MKTIGHTSPLLSSPLLPPLLNFWFIINVT